MRFRIDGVLHEVMRSPKSIQSGVTSRLKIMADINIAERRIPQDGRLSVNAYGRKVDLRVATLPTVWGEKVVMRILDNSTAMLDLKDLGFTGGNFDRYQTSYLKPYGMILVTGPTGSGKSTTLYSTLHQINKPEVNIITVEDPVEYRLPGINQVQTNAKAGLTFAAALRSILRADPDVVLIGEIRDHETAQIAIEASLTGHLVLATLHTNDAPSAVTRLIEMGIEPFLVGSALDCVLAQRLARRLCSKCKERLHADAETLVAARYPWNPEEPVPMLYRAVGCGACAQTGYKGRLALHEVMSVSEAVEQLTVERASSAAIENVAHCRGHGLAAPGRDAQGGHGDHVAGRDPARGGVTRGPAARSSHRGPLAPMEDAEGVCPDSVDARRDHGRAHPRGGPSSVASRAVRWQATALGQARFAGAWRSPVARRQHRRLPRLAGATQPAPAGAGPAQRASARASRASAPTRWRRPMPLPPQR